MTKWYRDKVKRLVHKKGPKKWQDRMAIEYFHVAGLHAASRLMDMANNDSRFAANVLRDYKLYLLRKALT